MSNKRILIFSLAYYPHVGGAEVAIKEITDRVRDMHFDMITLRFDKSEAVFEAIGNVHVHRVGWGKNYLNKILFIPLAVLKAWQLKRKNDYFKYWAMMTYMTFPIALLRLLGDRTPYILTLQDGDPFEHVFRRPHVRLFAPLLRKGFREASVVQVISNFLATWAKRLEARGRIEVIPNGVEVEKFAGQNLPSLGQEGQSRRDSVRLITTSRLVEKNGVVYIIEALKFLPESVSLQILGTGPLEAKLKSLTKKYNLEGRVEFVGHVDQASLPQFLQKADIFVRPSLSEGQGISFIEAFAAGIPVIATPVGGIPDFLFDPDKDKGRPPTGLLVPVRDSRAIARAVERLMKSDRLKETLITNAKRLVREKYDWDLIAGEMRRRVFDK